MQTVGTSGVDNFTQTATGFKAVFNAVINPAPASGALDVYGTSVTSFGVGASIDLTTGSTNTPLSEAA